MASATPALQMLPVHSSTCVIDVNSNHRTSSSPPLALSQEPPGNLPRFFPMMRELVQAYQVFSSYSDTHIRQLGLTPSQFDVIVTLSTTNGLSMRDLADQTLVTKGTLTGIVDRLEAKNLVRRDVPLGNRRSFTVTLTPEGKALFEQLFPQHLNYLKERFDRLETTELELLKVLLRKLRSVFE